MLKVCAGRDYVLVEGLDDAVPRGLCLGLSMDLNVVGELCEEGLQGDSPGVQDEAPEGGGGKVGEPPVAVAE